MKYRTHSTIQIDPQDFVFSTGISFEGLSITQAGIGWKIIVRGRGPRGQACYAIHETEDLWNGPSELLGMLERDGGRKMWRADKYRT